MLQNCISHCLVNFLKPKIWGKKNLIRLCLCDSHKIAFKDDLYSKAKADLFPHINDNFQFFYIRHVLAMSSAFVSVMIN